MMEAGLNASLWVTEEATALCSRDGVKNDSERASAVSRVIKATLNKLKSKTKTVWVMILKKKNNLRFMPQLP